MTADAAQSPESAASRRRLAALAAAALTLVAALVLAVWEYESAGPFALRVGVGVVVFAVASRVIVGALFRFVVWPARARALVGAAEALGRVDVEDFDGIARGRKAVDVALESMDIRMQDAWRVIRRRVVAGLETGPAHARYAFMEIGAFLTPKSDGGALRVLSAHVRVTGDQGAALTAIERIANADDPDLAVALLAEIAGGSGETAERAVEMLVLRFAPANGASFESALRNIAPALSRHLESFGDASELGGRLAALMDKLDIARTATGRIPSEGTPV